jgi:hypothetical protein
MQLLQAKTSHQSARWPFAAAICLLASVGVAAGQDTKPAIGPNPTAAATTPESATSQTTTDNSKAAILEELKVMQARIAQLQAQLGESGTSPAPAQSTTQETLMANTSSSQAQNMTPAPQKEEKPDPFSFADFTWMNGNPRTKDTPYATKFFTPEIRVDADYIYDFNHPKDDTISGSSEEFRSNEVQLTQFAVGGDFHWDNVRARFLTQYGLYSQATPRNDASPARGQWNLADAYRLFSEAYGGYHFNVLDGVNVDAGIFMSYVGLFSYYNFDNWAYQPSYVSSNTPWFFNGVRVQIFPNEHLKIEPWFINGWQSYGRFNGRPGLGGQVQWRPNGNIVVISNNYGVGADTLGNPNRTRYHTDDSIEVKYYDRPQNFFDKAAFTVTGDAGCETGGGVSCLGNSKDPKQSFLGFMAYGRWWFNHDHYGVTLGGGKINNPGRYLVLLPPINGATAASGTPYFTQNPGDPFKAWDTSATFDYMPNQYITFRWEYNYRHANVPYWSGSGGVTPTGGNQGAPGSLVAGFTPDLRRDESLLNMAILVKF